VQFVLTNKIITKFGVTMAILIFPLVLISGSVALLLIPVLMVATVIKGSDRVFGDTIYNSVMQLVMLPVPSALRGQAKGFLDGVVRNGAKLFAAVSVLVLAGLLAAVQFSYIIVALLGLCIFACIKIKKAYLSMLMATLHTKSEENEYTGVMDPASIKVMVDALLGDNAQQALYAFQFLDGMQGFDMAPHLPQLLRHTSDDVRIAALKYIRQNTPPDVEPLLHALVEDSAVGPHALLALAAYGLEDNFAALTCRLGSADYTMRSTAVAGLIKYYGIDGMFHAVGTLKEMLASSHEKERIAIAGLFGAIGVAGFYKPLVPMLSDTSCDVRVKALESAGVLCVPELVPHIVLLLAPATTRKHAVDALASYDEKIILPLVAPYLGDQRVCMHVPLVFEAIGTRAAFDTLLENYLAMSADMREKALDSAVRMKAYTLTNGEAVIMAEIKIWDTWTKHAGHIPKAEPFATLAEAAAETKMRIVKRIFRLLALLYDAKTFDTVYMNWANGNTQQQANAAEVIEQLLTGSLRTQVIRIMTEGDTADHPASHVDESLDILHPLADMWAQRLINAMRSGSGTDDLISRTKILRNITLFHGLTGRDLYAISPHLEYSCAAKEDVIMRENDAGDSLYLIKQGNVGVYVGSSKVAVLSGGDCFGEMAILTNQPRTATVVAENECELYRLTSDAFYDVLYERTEIAPELMRLLSRRLRAVNESVHTSDRLDAHAAEADNLAMPDEAMGSRDEQIFRRILLLQRVSLFANCSQKDFFHLASVLQERVFRKGERLCKEGDAGDAMYFIIEGQVAIHRGDEVLAHLGEGETVGEMAVIDGEVRSADCTAEVRTVVLILTKEELFSFCFRRVEVQKGIILSLAERLHDSSTHV
jgi:CRP-like cAMP-binding protein